MDDSIMKRNHPWKKKTSYKKISYGQGGDQY
jgi:hypothetical protein